MLSAHRLPGRYTLAVISLTRIERYNFGEQKHRGCGTTVDNPCRGPGRFQGYSPLIRRDVEGQPSLLSGDCDHSSRRHEKPANVERNRTCIEWDRLPAQALDCSEPQGLFAVWKIAQYV